MPRSAKPGILPPQLLPGGRLLYWAPNAKTENSAVYVAPLSDPSKRALVTHSADAFLYALGGDGKEYLLTGTEQAVVAREFNSKKLSLGPPRTVVTEVTYQPILPVAVSSGGLLLYAGGPKGGRFR